MTTPLTPRRITDLRRARALLSAAIDSGRDIRDASAEAGGALRIALCELGRNTEISIMGISREAAARERLEAIDNLLKEAA